MADPFAGKRDRSSMGIFRETKENRQVLTIKYEKIQDTGLLKAEKSAIRKVGILLPMCIF